MVEQHFDWALGGGDIRNPWEGTKLQMRNLLLDIVGNRILASSLEVHNTLVYAHSILLVAPA